MSDENNLDTKNAIEEPKFITWITNAWKNLYLLKSRRGAFNSLLMASFEIVSILERENNINKKDIEQVDTNSVIIDISRNVNLELPLDNETGNINIPINIRPASIPYLKSIKLQKEKNIISEEEESIKKILSQSLKAHFMDEKNIEDSLTYKEIDSMILGLVLIVGRRKEFQDIIEKYQESKNKWLKDIYDKLLDKS